MNNPKYISCTTLGEINKLIKNNPWQVVNYKTIPFPGVSPSPYYLSTLGSACYPSMATVSDSGIFYNSAIDTIRQDEMEGKIVFDVDRYLAQKSGNQYLIWKDLPPKYHWLKPTDQMVDLLPKRLKLYIKENYGKKLK